MKAISAQKTQIHQRDDDSTDQYVIVPLFGFIGAGNFSRHDAFEEIKVQLYATCQSRVIMVDGRERVLALNQMLQERENQRLPLLTVMPEGREDGMYVLPISGEDKVSEYVFSHEITKGKHVEDLFLVILFATAQKHRYEVTVTLAGIAKKALGPVVHRQIAEKKEPPPAKKAPVAVQKKEVVKRGPKNPYLKLKLEPKKKEVKQKKKGSKGKKAKK